VNTTQTWQPRAPAWSPVACYAAAAVVAVLISTWVTLVGPILIALGLGVLCANLLGPDIAARLGNQKLTQVVLRVGVALLGLRLPLSDLAAIGLRGAVIVIGVVSITFATTCIVGRRLGLDTGLVVLIAAGFSVCGAAAIAAIESSVRRRPADVATSIALVTIFGTAMILVIPLSASALGLSELQAGVWAGASIHEVAQVVAAASLAGPGALAAASTIKLARVSLLGGVFIASRVLPLFAPPASSPAACWTSQTW
jgi:uncharacterized integral membrane protein (TIGR00698 family)